MDIDNILALLYNLNMGKILIGDVCSYFTRGFRGTLENECKKEENGLKMYFQKEIYESNDWYFVTTATISEGFIGAAYKMKEKRRDLSKFILHKNDIIIPVVGPYFKSAFYNNVFPFVDDAKTNATLLASGNVYILEPNEAKIEPILLYAILSSPAFIFGLKNLALVRSKNKKNGYLLKEDILNIELPDIDERIAKSMIEDCIKRKKNEASGFVEYYNMKFGYLDTLEEKVNQINKLLEENNTEKAFEVLQKTDINKVKQLMLNTFGTNDIKETAKRININEENTKTIYSILDFMELINEIGKGDLNKNK